jgi:hypothetical protein
MNSQHKISRPVTYIILYPYLDMTQTRHAREYELQLLYNKEAKTN